MGKEDNGRVVARDAKMESNGEEDHREKGQNAVEKREGRTPVQQQQQHHAQRLSDTNSQETDVRAEARKAKSPVKQDNKLGETILRIVKAYLRNMSNPTTTTTTTTPSDSLPQNKLAASTSQHNNNNNNNNNNNSNTARIALVAAVPPPTLQSQHGVNQDSENRSDTDVGRGARGGGGEESNKVVIVTSRSEGVSTPHDSVSISHVQGTPSPTNVTLISPPPLSIRSSDASLPLPDLDLQGQQHHIVQKLPSSPSTLQFFKKNKVEYQQRPKFRAAGQAALRRGPMVSTDAGKHRHLRHSLPIEVTTTSFDINNNSFEEETPHGMTIVRTVRTSLSAPSLHGESTGKVVGGGAYGIKRDYSNSNGKNGQASLPLQWANERKVSAVAAPASSRAHSPQYQSHALLNTSSSIGVSTTAKVLTAAASEATKIGSEAARQKRGQQQQQQQQQPGSLSHATPALDSGTDQKLPQPQESKDDGPATALTSTTMAASEEAGIENGSKQRGETASNDGEGRGEESDRERRRSALAASVLKSAERMAMAENQDADAAADAITAKDAATATAAAAAAPTALKTVVEEESLGRQGRNNGSNTNANITSTSSHKYDGTALNGSEKQAQQTQKASGGWKVRINGEEMKTKAHAENKGEERADRDDGSERVAKVTYKQDARGSKEKDTDSVQLAQHQNGGKMGEKGSAGSDGSPQTPPLMQQASLLHKEDNRGEGGGEGGVLASMALPEGIKELFDHHDNELPSPHHHRRRRHQQHHHQVKEEEGGEHQGDQKSQGASSETAGSSLSSSSSSSSLTSSPEAISKNEAIGGGATQSSSSSSSSSSERTSSSSSSSSSGRSKTTKSTQEASRSSRKKKEKKKAGNDVEEEERSQDSQQRARINRQLDIRRYEKLLYHPSKSLEEEPDSTSYTSWREWFLVGLMCSANILLALLLCVCYFNTRNTYYYYNNSKPRCDAGDDVRHRLVVQADGDMESLLPLHGGKSSSSSSIMKIMDISSSTRSSSSCGISRSSSSNDVQGTGSVYDNSIFSFAAPFDSASIVRWSRPD